MKHDARDMAAGRGVWRMIGRAFRRRCPVCGRAPMFSGWLKMRDNCDACGFRFDRNLSDYFIGAYTINLIVSELLVVGLLVGIMLATWPDVPWTPMTWGIGALMLPAPLLMYPYSKSVWLAIDLVFQPAEPTDFPDGELPAIVRSGSSAIS